MITAFHSQNVNVIYMFLAVVLLIQSPHPHNINAKEINLKPK